MHPNHPRLRFASLLAIVALGLVAAAWLARPHAVAGPNCTVDASIDTEEAEFLRLINEHRQQNGLSPLALSDTLSRAAAWKSEDMAANGYFAHDDTPIGRTWTQRLSDCGYTFGTWLGENVAAGNASAAGTFQQWRNSPGHNANMLSANFAAIGIGRAYGASSQYGWYWTTDFGGVVDASPSTATPTASATAPPPTPTATRTPTSTTAPPTATSTPAATTMPLASPTPTAPPPTATAMPTSTTAPPTATSTPTATTAPFATPSATATALGPQPTPTIPLPPAGEIDPDGDVNCGGTTSSVDAALILQFRVDLIFSLPCERAGDVNQDGALDAVDAALILQYAAGLIGGLPV